MRRRAMKVAAMPVTVAAGPRLYDELMPKAAKDATKE
eukprot:CAMPEP_0185777574 /NCGR_PEP_ID=MMETSP1174-20130828/89945_1 /TAXON_ID=35687 /ORGANISM="Dictyocha speculum, Strain CCMP1381" /LENGTH=36 /DNA_ID= /DNA_START= /DNA_END= /DNA_ORIENTATION=